MKNLSAKTLFISLLLSAVVPSGVQADFPADIKDKLIKSRSNLSKFRANAAKATADFLNQARERPDLKYAVATILNQVRQRSELKYAVAAVDIVGVLYGLNYKFDLAAKVKKKIKKAWNNKWVRYSTYSMGTALAVTALYAGLVHKGYLPEFSAVKNYLICAWQEKSLKAPMLAYQSVPGAMRAAEVGVAIEAEQKSAEVGLGGIVKFGKAVRMVAADMERTVDEDTEKFLTQLDKQKLIVSPSYYITSLNPKWVKEVRDALKAVGVSDYLIEKISILGFKPTNNKSRTITMAKTSLNPSFFSKGPNKLNSYVPDRILINTEAKSLQSLPFERRFTFLHEAGHVKECCSTSGQLDYETGEVVADVFALVALTRPTERKKFQDYDYAHLFHSLPYLTIPELLRYGKELYDMQQKGDKPDVFAYARKILAARQMNWIMRVVEKFLGVLGFSLIL